MNSPSLPSHRSSQFHPASPALSPVLLDRREAPTDTGAKEENGPKNKMLFIGEIAPSSRVRCRIISSGAGRTQREQRGIEQAGETESCFFFISRMNSLCRGGADGKRDGMLHKCSLVPAMAMGGGGGNRWQGAAYITIAHCHCFQSAKSSVPLPALYHFIELVFNSRIILE